MNQPNPELIRKKQGMRLTWWSLAVALAGLLIVAVGVWWGLGQSSAPASQAPSQAPATTPAEPRLAVDRGTIDLGMQPFDRTVSAVFQVQNVGGDTLRILAEPVVELVEGC
jgi:hypothetical protein